MGKEKKDCHYSGLKLCWVYCSSDCWVNMSEGAQIAGKSGMRMALEGKLEQVGKWCCWHLARCSLGLLGFLEHLRTDCSGTMLGWVDWWGVGQGRMEAGVGVQGRAFAAGSGGFAGRCMV